jgi:hypothetical protein
MELDIPDISKLPRIKKAAHNGGFSLEASLFE